MSDRPEFVRQRILEINSMAKVVNGVDVHRITKFDDVFHEATIEGFRFIAYFSMGGLALKSPNGTAELGDRCKISCLQREPGRVSWLLGNNDNRDSITVRNCMSVNGIYAVAHEFGAGVIPWMDDSHRSFNPAMRIISSNWYRFYLTPAFRSLCEWAKAHPRKIRHMDDIGPGGVGDWQHAAQSGQYVWQD